MKCESARRRWRRRAERASRPQCTPGAKKISSGRKRRRLNLVGRQAGGDHVDAGVDLREAGERDRVRALFRGAADELFVRAWVESRVDFERVLRAPAEQREDLRGGGNGRKQSTRERTCCGVGAGISRPPILQIRK